MDKRVRDRGCDRSRKPLAIGSRELKKRIEQTNLAKPAAAALLLDSADAIIAARLERALHNIVPSRHVFRLCSNGSALAFLLRRQPDLVVSSGFGLAFVQGTIYCRLRHAILLTWLLDLPKRPTILTQKMWRLADGVLVTEAATSELLQSWGFPPSRVYVVNEGTPAPLPCGHDDSRLRRLLFVGAMEPESGAADFLLALVCWAEQYTSSQVEIWWVGDGPLRGVLAAQPTPGNLIQHFLEPISREELPSFLAGGGILVVPSFSGRIPDVVPEALSLGLPILGSSRSRAVRELVRNGLSGWVFDPLNETAMYRALNAALRCPVETLRRMGMLAQGREALNAVRSAKRVPQAERAVLVPQPAITVTTGVT
jgi:glycosyltransferase involved in cell wall biosynthesis